MAPSLGLSRALLVLSFLWSRAVVGVPPPDLIHSIRSNNGTSDGIGGKSLFELGRRDEDPDLDDLFDLSWIKKIAAIGDSYSAGIGAGTRLGSIAGIFDDMSDYSCARYNRSYPYLVNEDWRLGDKNGRKFEFMSCSGAVAQDVTTKQIPKISNDQQVILLSIGGNNAQLVDVLNQCVFQWAIFDTWQTLLLKIQLGRGTKIPWLNKILKFIPVDKFIARMGKGCPKQLEETRGLIASPEMHANLTAVLSAAKEKLAPGGKIYMTGYARFFNADTTGCDNVSWRSWISRTWNGNEGIKLTRENRKNLNNLVDAMNSKLNEVADKFPEVVFINYDKYVRYFKGRFCEKGVDESSTDSNNRTGLMFYKWDTFEPSGNTPYKRSTDEEVYDTFAGTISAWVGITRAVAGKDAQFADPKMAAVDLGLPKELTGDMDAGLINAPRPDEAAVAGDAAPTPGPGVKRGWSTLQTREGELQSRSVPNFIPDGYGRVFHPTILLHSMIAKLIIHHIASYHYKETTGGLLFPEDVEPTGACPMPAKPPTDKPKENGAKWNITIYDNVQCFQPDQPKALPIVKINDQTRSRTIFGNETNQCYTFNDDMPGTDCFQLRENGKVREACDPGKLTPQSASPMPGSNCIWYTKPGCGGIAMEVPEDQRRCIDAPAVEIGAKELRSFKCRGPK